MKAKIAPNKGVREQDLTHRLLPNDMLETEEQNDLELPRKSLRAPSLP